MIFSPDLCILNYSISNLNFHFEYTMPRICFFVYISVFDVRNSVFWGEGETFGTQNELLQSFCGRSLDPLLVDCESLDGN